MSLILRGDKEQKLNISELDGNFQYKIKITWH